MINYHSKYNSDLVLVTSTGTASNTYSFPSGTVDGDNIIVIVETLFNIGPIYPYYGNTGIRLFDDFNYTSDTTFTEIIPFSNRTIGGCTTPASPGLLFLSGIASGTKEIDIEHVYSDGSGFARYKVMMYRFSNMDPTPLEHVSYSVCAGGSNATISLDFENPRTDGDVIFSFAKGSIMFENYSSSYWGTVWYEWSAEGFDDNGGTIGTTGISSGSGYRKPFFRIGGSYDWTMPETATNLEAPETYLSAYSRGQDFSYPSGIQGVTGPGFLDHIRFTTPGVVPYPNVIMI